MTKKKMVIQPDVGEIFDLELDEHILAKNLELANQNALKFNEKEILSIDIMGSIGAGKTTLIEQVVKQINSKYRIFVLGGDVTTTIDVDRVAKHDVNTLQINTGKECHLDAYLINKSLKYMNLDQLDVIIIENVGNLICPGEFPLGAEKRIVVISVTEGPYMVIKHPFIFRTAEIVVINKIDLAETMEVSPERLKADVLSINQNAKVIFTVARKGEGIAELIQFLGL